MKHVHNQTFKPFTEYREKDYRVPRSIKEAYGYDTTLYVNTKPGLLQKALEFIGRLT